MRPSVLRLAALFACGPIACAVGAAPAAVPAPCVLNAQPETIAVEQPGAGEYNEVYELPETPEWWAPAPMDRPRTEYRAALVARLGSVEAVAPGALLARARAVYGGLAGAAVREVENIDALAQGRAGSIVATTCLEWRLFQRQAAHFPMIEQPTELSAYLLRGRGRIRVYLSGADRVGGRLRGEVSDRVAADVARGFTPVAHLHNHPFLFDRTPGDRTWATPDTLQDVAGTLAASLTDVQVYHSMREHFGLRGAWITNGLDTSRYTSGDFDRLSGWP